MVFVGHCRLDGLIEYDLLGRCLHRRHCLGLLRLAALYAARGRVPAVLLKEALGGHGVGEEVVAVAALKGLVTGTSRLLGCATVTAARRLCEALLDIEGLLALTEGEVGITVAAGDEDGLRLLCLCLGLLGGCGRRGSRDVFSLLLLSGCRLLHVSDGALDLAAHALELGDDLVLSLLAGLRGEALRELLLLELEHAEKLSCEERHLCCMCCFLV